MTAQKKILFVCMQNSPHACRWINSLADRGWDLHVFPFRYYDALSTLRGVTVHRPFLRARVDHLIGALRQPLSAWWDGLKENEASHYPHRLPHEAIFPLPIPYRVEALLARIMVRTGESDATASLLYGPWVLSRLIRQLRPDLIHSMEFQHNGYNVLKAREILGPNFPPWLASNWGSDIYHFQNVDEHRAQIRRLLKHIDFYSCECARDVALARELGTEAKVLPVMPNSGGFDIDQAARMRSEISTSRRRVIMVKGYQHFAGRALTALDALARCADIVKDFDVVLFSPSPEAIKRADELRSSTEIRSITVLPQVSHELMLRMHSMARVYLGVSISDAISTSALEAMAMGAFPIQTDTSCCDEWFEHGTGGYLIPPDDTELIVQRLRSALTDDNLVDSASAINWQTVVSRLDQRDVDRRVGEFYDEAFAGLEQSKAGME